MASFDCIRSSHAAGVAAINAWAAGERGKIAAAHSAHIAADGGVAALSAEFKSLEIEPSLYARFVGQVVHIHNAHGRNLQLRDNKTWSQHENKGGWEKFLIVASGDGEKVFIESVRHEEGGKKQRLQSNVDKKSIGVHTNSGGWEKWQLIPVDGKNGSDNRVMLRTNFGTQLSQDDHGALHQSANTAAWEKFTLIFADGDARAAHKAGVAARLHAAEAAAKAAADATAASQTAALDAEVARRIGLKNADAARIEGEVRALAAF